MKYLNGKNLQKKILMEIKNTVTLLNIKPVVAVISIGGDLVNQLFFRQIKKMCDEVGYEIKHYYYEEVSLKTLLELIDKLNYDNKITSILIENPIPDYLPKAIIRNRIIPSKDIEGITDYNRIRLTNNEGGFLPGTVLGIIYLLEEYNISIEKKNVVIINRSESIGKPLAEFFLSKDCTVTICHSKTIDLEMYLKSADIVISAVGKSKILVPQFFKDGTVIVDVGLECLDGTFYGDLDLSCEEKWQDVSIIKSIGGVGPMTIAAIAQNILKSYYINLEGKDEI